MLRAALPVALLLQVATGEAEARQQREQTPVTIQLPAVQRLQTVAPAYAAAAHGATAVVISSNVPWVLEAFDVEGRPLNVRLVAGDNGVRAAPGDGGAAAIRGPAGGSVRVEIECAGEDGNVAEPVGVRLELRPA